MCDPGEKEADVVGQSSKAGRGRPSEMSSTSKTQSPLSHHVTPRSQCQAPASLWFDPNSMAALVRPKLNGRSGC